MKKSRTLSFLSKRAAMLFVVASVSVGALAQTIKVEGTKAIIDGSSEETVSEDINGKTVFSIVYNRTFTPGRCATVMFPFKITGSNTVSGGTFYKFECVSCDGDHGWLASMVEETSLSANIPYLLLPSAPNLTFNLNSAVTLNRSVSLKNADGCDCECWKFIGSYEKVTWGKAHIDYGFAASNEGSVEVGDFVALGGIGDGLATNSYIKPMRCFLRYVGPDPAYVPDPLYPDPAYAPSRTRSADNGLPERIGVILRAVDGSVTSVGTISTETGEVSFEGWFTLDGVKLPAEPTANGIYIHNGKKVAVTNK